VIKKIKKGRKNNIGKKGWGKFVIGAGIGAGLGLLFAPKKGSELRADLKVKADELIKKAKEIDMDDVAAMIEEKIYSDSSRANELSIPTRKNKNSIIAKSPLFVGSYPPSVNIQYNLTSNKMNKNSIDHKYNLLNEYNMKKSASPVEKSSKNRFLKDESELNNEQQPKLSKKERKAMKKLQKNKKFDEEYNALNNTRKTYIVDGGDDEVYRSIFGAKCDTESEEEISPTKKNSKNRRLSKQQSQQSQQSQIDADEKSEIQSKKNKKKTQKIQQEKLDEEVSNVSNKKKNRKNSKNNNKDIVLEENNTVEEELKEEVKEEKPKKEKKHKEKKEKIVKEVKKHNIILFLFWFLIILFLEASFKLIMGISFTLNSIINITLYSLIVSSILSFLSSVFPVKANRVIIPILLFILGLLFNVELVFHKIFKTYFSLTNLGLGDQAASFIKDALIGIVTNIIFYKALE